MKLLRFIIIIPLIIFFILLAAIGCFSQTQPESVLLRAFTDSGAEIVSTEITFTGSCLNKLNTQAEITAFYIGISETLGADKSIEPQKINNESFEGIELNNMYGRNCNYTLKVLRSKIKSELGRCYVTLYLVDSSSTPELCCLKSKIIDMFDEKGIKPEVNTCFTGRYPGKLKTSDMNEICSGIFKRTEAIKVNGIRENNLISVSAYSKKMGESVVIGGKNINLNFAARYNSYEDKTYIWLATPLITTEY